MASHDERLKRLEQQDGTGDDIAPCALVAASYRIAAGEDLAEVCRELALPLAFMEELTTRKPERKSN